MNNRINLEADLFMHLDKLENIRNQTEYDELDSYEKQIKLFFSKIMAYISLAFQIKTWRHCYISDSLTHLKKFK